MGVFYHIIQSLLPDRITPVWRKFAQQRKAAIQVTSDILITYPWKECVFHIEDRMDSISGTSRQLNFSIARTEIASNSDFSLLITREGLLPAISKLFGKKEIQVDSGEFDQAFYIRTTDEQIAQAILQNSAIRALLLRLSAVRLQVGREPGYFDEKPSDGFIMIYAALDHELKTVAHLELFEQLLQELASAVSMYAKEPFHDGTAL